MMKSSKDENKEKSERDILEEKIKLAQDDYDRWNNNKRRWVENTEKHGFNSVWQDNFGLEYFDDDPSFFIDEGICRSGERLRSLQSQLEALDQSEVLAEKPTESPTAIEADKKNTKFRC